MLQGAREEAIPLFGQGDHSAHMQALLLTIPTHAECCRMRGRKQLYCPMHSVGVTQHRSKHCRLQSQHKLHGARCQEGTTPTHAECRRMRGRKQLHCSGVATTHYRSRHRCLQSQHMLNVAGCEGGSSSTVRAWRPLITGAGTVAYNPNTC